MRLRTIVVLSLAALALGACADIPLGKWKDNTVVPPGERPRPNTLVAQ